MKIATVVISVIIAAGVAGLIIILLKKKTMNANQSSKRDAKGKTVFDNGWTSGESIPTGGDKGQTGKINADGTITLPDGKSVPFPIMGGSFGGRFLNSKDTSAMPVLGMYVVVMNAADSNDGLGYSNTDINNRINTLNQYQIPTGVSANVLHKSGGSNSFLGDALGVLGGVIGGATGSSGIGNAIGGLGGGSDSGADSLGSTFGSFAKFFI